MPFTTIILAALAGSFAHTGTYVTLWSGTDCQGEPYGSREVDNDSCATGTGGFQSFKITDAGPGNYGISAYSRDGCAGNVNGCIYANQPGICVNSLQSDGGANALGSSTFAFGC